MKLAERFCHSAVLSKLSLKIAYYSIPDLDLSLSPQMSLFPVKMTPDHKIFLTGVGMFAGYLISLYEQLLLSTCLPIMSFSPSRWPLSTKSEAGVWEDRGSSWEELWCSGYLLSLYEQLLLSTCIPKMSFSPSRWPLSTKTEAGVWEDRGSSWQELGPKCHLRPFWHG